MGADLPVADAGDTVTVMGGVRVSDSPSDHDDSDTHRGMKRARTDSIPTQQLLSRSFTDASTEDAHAELGRALVTEYPRDARERVSTMRTQSPESDTERGTKRAREDTDTLQRPVDRRLNTASRPHAAWKDGSGTRLGGAGFDPASKRSNRQLGAWTWRE